MSSDARRRWQRAAARARRKYDLPPLALAHAADNLVRIAPRARARAQAVADLAATFVWFVPDGYPATPAQRAVAERLVDAMHRRAGVHQGEQAVAAE